MKTYNLLTEISTLPAPFDTEKVDLGFQTLHETTQRLRERDQRELAEFTEFITANPAGRTLLSVVFGNSPFLTQCIQRQPDTLRKTLVEGPDAAYREIMREIREQRPPPVGDRGLWSRLRIAKQRIALVVGLADITGMWSLEEVTGSLSEFAAETLQALTAQLLREAAATGELNLPNEATPCRDSGFAILGMGKLGAGELNYSSDIDLIVLYDQDVADYRGRRSLQDCYVRLTRELVKGMQDRMPDGYVFRTDLRLRPDPGATPLAISMAAAENYYEGMGQNWERAAMIKARPVAGDLEAGRRFLERIQPFIWRKHLDFAAIEDIHSIKRQMHAHRGHAKIAVAGHNLKLGAGGIREIEFFAQTQQLIAGGRDRRLRDPTTCGAIRALAATDRLDPRVADELIESYRFLRRLEHRLQMIGDEQTHTLPDTERGLAHVATFMGYDSPQDFSAEVRKTLESVQRHYAALFREAPALGPKGSLVFTGSEDDPDTLKTLAQFGFKEIKTISATVRKWHHGRYRATRSERAREKLTTLLPSLLESLAHTANPDQAFLRFDEFLGNLPAGIQLFSLFLSNPALLDLVADIMGTSADLADTLSRRPTLLDAVLSADFYDALPPQDELAADLAAVLEEADDFQDVLDGSRSWANERKFQCGVQVLQNTISASAAGSMLSDVAEVLIRAIKEQVEKEFSKAHGTVPSSGMAVLAMGKLGGREMTPASDLDLIFVYDFDPDVTSSDGEKPLAPSQCFNRLSQRIINAITALTPEGQLYEVDMRLRPSGRSGPLAVSLESFRRYQEESAWTWEHMALTRARLVAGPLDLRAAVNLAVRNALLRDRDPGRLALDVLDMRRRLEREKPATDPWQLKFVRGGLVDTEFVCQFLQLRYAHAHPGILDTNTVNAFTKLASAGVLSNEAAEGLSAATLFLTDLQGLLRLCTSKPFDAAMAPDGLRRALVRAVRTRDFDELQAELMAKEKFVLDQFNRLIAGIPP